MTGSITDPSWDICIFITFDPVARYIIQDLSHFIISFDENFTRDN